MKVNKICYFLMQDQLLIEPHYNKKILKFILGEINGKHGIKQTFFLIEEAQNFR